MSKRTKNIKRNFRFKMYFVNNGQRYSKMQKKVLKLLKRQGFKKSRKKRVELMSILP